MALHDKCDCHTCQDLTHLKRISEKLSLEDVAFIESLYERLMATEMDLAHAHAILHGTWPNAESHLWHSLKRTLAERNKKDLDTETDS